jgi:uncharacterized protein (DUF2235 family)
LRGAGLDENVCEAYNFLVNNYTPGDELFFFGFSRGAYTVRACAGLVCRVGICQASAMTKFWEMYANYKAIQPDHLIEESLWAKQWPMDQPAEKYSIKVKGTDWEFTKGSGYQWFKQSSKNVTIKVIGVWDTVGSLGYPENIWKDVTAWNKPYGFHNTDIHPRKICRCRNLMPANEARNRECLPRSGFGRTPQSFWPYPMVTST